MSCKCHEGSGAGARSPEDAEKFDELDRYITSLLDGQTADRRRGLLIQILHRAQHRYKINVCTGTACFVKGAPKVLDEFKRRLNISEGQSTADGKFFLGALRCVGACSLAPVVMVNDKVYGNVTAEKVAGILADCAD